MNLKEIHFSKVFFKHLFFYYEPKSFVFPVAVFIDKIGLSVCVAFFGLVWNWNELNDD